MSKIMKAVKVSLHYTKLRGSELLFRIVTLCMTFSASSNVCAEVKLTSDGFIFR